MKLRWVGVFCGSKSGTNPIYADAARELGGAIAQRGAGLVFGGGSVGLMGVVADAVLAAGGPVYGVIPHSLATVEALHTGLTELQLVDTMHQRKALMAERADAFIALPGGYGTCDELFEILTWRQIGLHNKPVALLNVAGYFDPLLAWADRMVADGFLRQGYRDYLQVTASVAAIWSMLEGGGHAA